MFTVGETAKRLNCSVSSVRALIAAGRLSCHRIGLRRGCIRVSEAQLQLFLNVTETTQERREAKAPAPLQRKNFKHLRV